MREAEFIKISDEEAKLLTETDTLELAVKYLIDSKLNAIAITLGKEGTMIIKDGKATIIGSHQNRAKGFNWGRGCICRSCIITIIKNR